MINTCRGHTPNDVVRSWPLEGVTSESTQPLQVWTCGDERAKVKEAEASSHGRASSPGSMQTETSQDVLEVGCRDVRHVQPDGRGEEHQGTVSDNLRVLMQAGTRGSDEAGVDSGDETVSEDEAENRGLSNVVIELPIATRVREVSGARLDSAEGFDAETVENTATTTVSRKRKHSLPESIATTEDVSRVDSAINER